MTKDEFIDQIVLGWIKADLVSISKIRTVIPGSGNVNFPLATLIVIYMDHLGGYLLGTDKGGIEANIREYLTCFKNPLDYPSELLTDLFRNGLGHDYFARGAISRSGLRPPMIKADGVGVILDADSLLYDFIESLDRFKNKLSEENFKKRFIEAGNKMNARYIKHKSIIDRLPKSKIQVEVSPTIRATGASGTTIHSEDIRNL